MTRTGEHLSDTLKGRITYDGTDTPAKTALFLIVCAAWLVPGLIGHDPWKTDDAVTFGVVSEMLKGGTWLIPAVSGEAYLERAPLFFWVAAIFAKVFGGLLPLQDAARLAAGFFMAITLAATSLIAMTIHGERAARIAVLLLIGCVGLLIRAHEMSTDIAGLAGVALGLLGIALGAKRPRTGGAVAGLGLATAFLGDGFFPAFLLVATGALMPATGGVWRTRGYAVTAGIALAIALPLAAIWPVMFARGAPALWHEWLRIALASRWSGPDTLGAFNDLFYFARIIAWYAWPALPLAAWTLWRARKSLRQRTNLHLPLVAFAVFFAALTLLADAREVNALPLLLPLVLLGIAEIDSIRRGAASALDWFGVTTFSLFGALIWLGWFAALTGSPEVIAAWLQREVPGYKYTFRFIPFTFAMLLTLVWIVVVARSLRTTRRAVVNWAAGITMTWMLVMTLGLPIVNEARSYRGVSERLRTALGGSLCTIGIGLGDPQRALLDHYIQLRTYKPDHPNAANCKTLLVQAAQARLPGVEPQWTETWRGSRPGDKTELFILYRRN